MKFKVRNMSCIHCKKKIEEALKALGVKKIKIDLEEKVCSVVLKKVTPEQVEQAIMKLGYDFELL